MTENDIITPLSSVDRNVTEHAPGPRVLQLLPELMREEPVQAALGLVRPIVDSGGIAVVGSIGGRLEPQLERAGGKLARLQPPQMLDFRNAANLEILTACCAEHRLQVIHAHGLRQVQLAAALAAATGLPLIQSCYELPDRTSLTAYLKLRALSRANRVVAASGYLSDQIRKMMPKQAHRVVTVAYGINIEAFDEAAVTTARTISLAEVWGVIEDSRPIIMVPARPDDAHWPDRVCNIVRETLKQHDGVLDAQFVLVGEGRGTGRTARMERRILASGLAEHIRLVGHCADPEAALKLASLVLAFNEKPRGVCYNALQAQAMGRPIILGDSGAASESVENGVTGWLVDPDNPEHVAQCVLAALAMDESERAHLALAARARIVSGNSAQVMHRHIQALYDEVSGKGAVAIPASL